MGWPAVHEIVAAVTRSGALGLPRKRMTEAECFGRQPIHATLREDPFAQRLRPLLVCNASTPYSYEGEERMPDLTPDAVLGWLNRFPDQRFSLSEAVSFEVMRRERLTSAFACDRHFEVAGFELLE
jgi:hypothetical protein